MSIVNTSDSQNLFLCVCGGGRGGGADEGLRVDVGRLFSWLPHPFIKIQNLSMSYMTQDI